MFDKHAGAALNKWPRGASFIAWLVVIAAYYRLFGFPIQFMRAESGLFLRMAYVAPDEIWLELRVLESYGELMLVFQERISGRANRTRSEHQLDMGRCW